MDSIVNAREPRGEEGRRFLEHMNADHEEMARWGTSFLMIGRDYDVLDVGCGGGRNVQYFLERCDKGTVTGIDMSEMSVKVSKEVNSEEIEKGRCRILQGNVTALPFDELSFDIVTAFETVYYWPSIVDSFKGILNVLRRGGRFMICNEADEINERTQSWVDRIGHDMKVYNAEQLKGYLEEAGFTDIEVHRIPENQWLCLVAMRPYD